MAFSYDVWYITHERYEEMVTKSDYREAVQELIDSLYWEFGEFLQKMDEMSGFGIVRFEDDQMPGKTICRDYWFDKYMSTK